MKRLQKFSFSFVFLIALVAAQSAFAQYDDPSQSHLSPGSETVFPVGNESYARTLNDQSPPLEPAPGSAEPSTPPKDGSANSSSGTQASGDQCDQDAASADKACREKESMAGMKAAQQYIFMQTMTQLSSQLAQASSQKGAAAACYATAAIGPLVAILSGLKHDACKTEINACAKSCKIRLQTAKAKGGTDPKAADNLQACSGYNSNANAMMMQIAVAGMSVAQAMQCGKGSSSAKATVPLTPAQLQQAPGCFDMACYCQTNPSEPVCSSGNNGLTPTGTGLAGGGGLATPEITTPGGDPNAVDMSKLDTKPMSGSQANTPGGAGGGGMPGGGAGGGAPFAGEGDGTAGPGINKDVITGTSSGGGGVAALGAAAGSGGGGAKGSSSDGGGGGGFNLSKYLPKSLFKNRGLAGMSVPATDGVTGPTGPSIWEKVHAQYENKKATLIQDK